MKKTAILSLLLILLCGLAEAQAPKTPSILTPNLFQFHSDKLHITYDISSATPHFTYQDTVEKLEFSGEQIRKVDNSDIGTLVSVTTRMTVDAGSSTFTLLIPRVNLVGTNVTDVRTYGIFVVHRFSVKPSQNKGELDTYVSNELIGTGEHVAPQQ